MRHGAGFIVGAVITLLALYYAAKVVDERLLPVFGQVELVVIKVGEGHTDLLLRGVKNRGCTLVSAVATVKVGATKVQVVPFMLKGDGTVLHLNEQRLSKGTRFVRLIRVPAVGDITSIKATSACHPLWQTEQEIMQPGHR